MTHNLVRTTAFVRAATSIEEKRKATNDVEAALTILSNNAFDPRLKTHKLKGDLDEVWACSAGYDLRILFAFVQLEGAEAILLLNVGTHDEVY